jgi:hypothetical protein
MFSYAMDLVCGSCGTPLVAGAATCGECGASARGAKTGRTLTLRNREFVVNPTIRDLDLADADDFSASGSPPAG